jgi:hypothetical protein
MPHDEPSIHHRLSGLTPTDAEREFIRAERPWGFILFRRNIDKPAQVAAPFGIWIMKPTGRS